MKKKAIFFLITFFSIAYSYAQQESIEQQGEIGINIGAAHYFGDLNPRTSIKKPKASFGIFFLKQFTNYLGVRASVHYAGVGFSDSYSKNDFQKKRNLDFNSSIWEFAVNGEFNFFRFVPNDANYLFTPYLTVGLGIFSFNPYTERNGIKEFLQPLGTEGQNVGYIDISGKKRSPYKKYAFSMPFGAGIKYNVSKSMNFSFQLTHRLTTTDYLDDVSTTYVGIDKFGADPIAAALQDRSGEKGAVIGVEGRQRGWSKQKDQYVIAEIGLSFNINRYRCPTYR